MRNWLAEFSRTSKRNPGKINVEEQKSKLEEFKSFVQMKDNHVMVLYSFCMLRGKKQHVCIGELIEYLENQISQDEIVSSVESLVVKGFFLFGSEGPFSNYYDHIYLSHPAEVALRNSDHKSLPKYPESDDDYILMFIYARAVSFRNRSILLKEWIDFTHEAIKMREIPFLKYLYSAKLSKKDNAIALFTAILHQIDQHRLETNTLIQLFCNTALEISRMKKELANPMLPLYTKELLERHKNEYGLIRIGAHDSWGSTLHSQIDTTVKVAPLSPALQLFDYRTIYPKKLFYNPDTNEKVRILRKILIPTNFKKFENRTKKNGDCGGVISLLSGGPGTGKTELARQLALETQRDLLLFEVTEQRNMYFGETEKAIKQVFSDYRRIARQVKNAPILFFNEGDSVFAKRKESNSNTSQTENTVQTILLQELEVFTGILIITTNLPNSFDAAFDRRILLKIDIGNPNAEVRFDLIRYIFPMISIDAAKNLSLNYEFTAAQLGVFQKQWELKSIIKEIRGSQVEALEQFLASLNSTYKRRIGFVA
jgi:hypothetical protein